MNPPESSTPSADPLEVAREILDTMLGYLGFVVDVRIEGTDGGRGLQVHTSEAELLVGRGGDRLDDIQYLLNRLLHVRLPDAPKVRVDVGHFRVMREDRMIEEIRSQAERVRTGGRPLKLQPMNAYYRRLVHNAFKDDPVLETWSPRDQSRLKRIVIRRRDAGDPAP